MIPWWVWGYLIATVIITAGVIFWLEHTRIKGLGLDGRPEVPEVKIEKPETTAPKSQKKETAEAGKER